MISRCPSCGAQVADDAQQCPHCYWDFEKFKRVPPPGQPAAAPPPPARASSEPEPTPVPEPELVLPPAPAPEPVAPPSLPSFPVKPTPATPARADGGGLSLPQFGKIDRVQPLGPVAGLPPAAGPAALPPPERSAAPVPPPIPKAPTPRLPAAAPAPEKKAPAPAKESAGHAAEPPPPLTMVHSGGSWGSAPMPKPSAAKPASDGQAAGKPKPGAARAPLLNRATAGIVLAGIAFVVVTHFALRPDVKEGRRASSPVFAKGERQPLRLPMPEPPAPKPAEPPAAPVVVQPAVPLSTSAVAVVAAVAASSAPVVPAARPSRTELPKAEPEKAPAPPAPKPRPQPASRPKDAGPSWAFYGMVYDLISLRPVYGAALTFKSPSGAAAGEASTSEDGGYEISLEPLSEAGYSLLVKHPDYQDKYIDEISPPFREVSLEERRLLVRMAARARPWVGKATLTVRRDFVMIPKE